MTLLAARVGYFVPGTMCFRALPEGHRGAVTVHQCTYHDIATLKVDLGIHCAQCARFQQLPRKPAESKNSIFRDKRIQ